jgi:hypothetical protein
MKREIFLKHLRGVVLFCKKRRTVEEIPKTLSYKHPYTRKVLQSKPIRLYVVQLIHGFIEKARGYFDQLVAELPLPKTLDCAASKEGK